MVQRMQIIANLNRDKNIINRRCQSRIRSLYQETSSETVNINNICYTHEVGLFTYIPEIPSQAKLMIIHPSE